MCTSSVTSVSSTSSAASDARIRYDVQNFCLATELQQHFISLIQQELNVDVLCDRLEACMKSAVCRKLVNETNFSHGLIAVAEKPSV